MKTNCCFFVLLWWLIGFCDNGSATIAFVANQNNNWDLFVTDEQGSNTIQLTQTDYDEKDPSWSAARNEIIYAASDGQLRIINVKTRTKTLTAPTPLKTPQISPSFSPDGKKITFAQFRLPEEGDDTDLMTYDLETRGIKRLIDQYAIQMWPVWSPDGSRIVYANMHCSGECGRLIQELWIMNPHDQWSRQLLLTHSFCQQPVWSPDGFKIAFSSDKRGNYDIWITDLRNLRLTQVTTHEGLDVKPAWSADGTQVAFVSTRSGLMEIWIKDLVQGTLRPLRPFGKQKIECKDVAW